MNYDIFLSINRIVILRKNTIHWTNEHSTQTQNVENVKCERVIRHYQLSQPTIIAFVQFDVCAYVGANFTSIQFAAYFTIGRKSLANVKFCFSSEIVSISRICLAIELNCTDKLRRTKNAIRETS